MAPINNNHLIINMQIIENQQKMKKKEKKI